MITVIPWVSCSRLFATPWKRSLVIPEKRAGPKKASRYYQRIPTAHEGKLDAIKYLRLRRFIGVYKLTAESYIVSRKSRLSGDEQRSLTRALL